MISRWWCWNMATTISCTFLKSEIRCSWLPVAIVWTEPIHCKRLSAPNQFIANACQDSGFRTNGIPLNGTVQCIWTSAGWTSAWHKLIKIFAGPHPTMICLVIIVSVKQSWPRAIHHGDAQCNEISPLASSSEIISFHCCFFLFKKEGRHSF